MRWNDSCAAGGGDVRLLVGALDRDAPLEPAERGHRVDEAGVREHHAVGEDDDVLEPELDRPPERGEEALVQRRLAAEEGEVGGAGGAGPLDGGDDRVDLHRAGDLQRGELAAGAEDAPVVAQVAELDLVAVAGPRRGDGRRGTRSSSVIWTSATMCTGDGSAKRRAMATQ